MHIGMNRHVSSEIDDCLHPGALSGPYRPRGAHGISADLIHFSGKSACFGRKLSDRIVREFGLGACMSATRESKALFLRSGGKYMIVAKLPSSPTLTRVVWGALIRR